MNRIFFDTEFIEGHIDGRHFIDLISIGLVREDGETYEAFSKEYRYELASDWVKENVISPLFKSKRLAVRKFVDETNFHLFNGKTNEKIAKEVKKFVGEDPIFYGYYADYDWVLLCSLYGTMMNLPKTWPMYCRDIQQIIDGENIDKKQLKLDVPQEDQHNALSDALWNKKAYEYVKEKMKK